MSNKYHFSIPEGGFYRFTLKIMPVLGGQPQEYQKVIKAKSYEEAGELFNKWLFDKPKDLLALKTTKELER